jgi:hypothetical protein
MITLSITDLRALLDIDDDLALERAWLMRNTSALPDCTVIKQELAEQIRAQDKDGAIIKVISYPVDLFTYSKTLQSDVELFIPHITKALAVYTAWTPITWNESQEKSRLSKYEDSEWRRDLRIKEACIEEASLCAERLGRRFGKHNREQFFNQIIEFSIRAKYDVEKIKLFIAEVDKVTQ